MWQHGVVVAAAVAVVVCCEQHELLAWHPHDDVHAHTHADLR
jgi:hypothetical protein